MAKLDEGGGRKRTDTHPAGPADPAIALGEDGRIVEEPGNDEIARLRSGWAPSSAPVGVDRGESTRLRRRIHALPKECWFNARRAVLRLDDYGGASYVEGLAVTRQGMLIEHGWVARDGWIVDPTLPGRVAAYFAGLEFRGRAGIAEFLATPLGRGREGAPFFHAFGWSGCECPYFARARAEAHALGLLSKVSGNGSVWSPPPDDNSTGERG